MNIGRVLLIPKGDYNGATNYMMLDWVRHNGASWVCKVDNTIGIAPSSSTSTNWQILAEDGSVSGSVDWNTGVTNKPFSSVSATDFDVDAVTDELSIKGYGNKADKSTTLAGYGITDAYTKTTVDSALAAKLTTPAGGSPGNALIKDASGNPAWGSVGADFISSVSNEFDVPSSGSDKGKLSLSSSITSKLVNLDSDGEISGAHVNYDANNTVNDKIDGLETSKADTTELDSWHKYNNVIEEITVNTTGDSSVAFHGINTSKTYEIYFDTADGSQPNFKGSLLTGTTMTYTVNISSTDALPAKFRLAVKNSLS